MDYLPSVALGHYLKSEGIVDMVRYHPIPTIEYICIEVFSLDGYGLTASFVLGSTQSSMRYHEFHEVMLCFFLKTRSSLEPTES